MGLCAFDDPARPSIVRGTEYLIRAQNPDGSWTEHETTGTGFPKVFYLKYDMYRNSWPLLALATYRQLLADAPAGAEADDQPYRAEEELAALRQARAGSMSGVSNASG